MSDPLQPLADHVRRAIAADRSASTWSSTTWAVLGRLTDALAEQHPRRLAEWAVTAAILTQRPLRDCVDLVAADDAWARTPTPRRGRHGFTPDQARPQPEQHR